MKRLAEEHGLRLMHDAAHSFGSRARGRPIGSFSDLCMFSFDPIKNVTCIDGGALVVRSEDEVQQLHELRMIGMGQPAVVSYQNRRAWTYDVQRQGFRYHLANLHAKVGLAQLGKLDRIRQSRRDTTRRFNDAFASLPDVGHVISGDNVINLKRLDDSDAICPGDKLLMIMAGYGMNWQSVLLEKV